MHARIVQVVDPTTGKPRTMTITQALHAGLIRRRHDGFLVYTPLGHSMTSASTESDRSARTAPQTVGSSMAGRIESVAATIGKTARYPMLGSSILKIAQSNGTPAWQTMYFAANGVNRICGGTWMPSWLSTGPVKIAIEGALLLPALESSFDSLPGARAHYRSARASGSMLHAATSRMPSPAAPPPSSHHNIPALSSLFKFVRPLYLAGMTMSCVSGMLDLPAYLMANGTKGMISTKSGRAAWIGAISSAAMLGAMWLPASPLAAYVDLASNVLWGAELVNGHGWLDGILGPDPS